MSRRQSRAAARHREQLGRAGAGVYRTLLHTAEATAGAQWVIAWRLALLQHAMADLRRADDPEFSRMVTEKVEAALAVAPAMASGWGRTQMELLRIWQSEVVAFNATLARLAVSGSPAAVAEVAGEVAADAADRSAKAALDLMISNTRLMTAVLGPYHRRIRGNVRRLGGA